MTRDEAITMMQIVFNYVHMEAIGAGQVCDHYIGQILCGVETQDMLDWNNCRSALRIWANRGEKALFREFIEKNFSARNAQVHKFIPGEHFHTLDEKFDTLAQAKVHIQDRGMAYGGLVQKHVYDRIGD